jgi:hypothetical protein
MTLIRHNDTNVTKIESMEKDMRTLLPRGYIKKLMCQTGVSARQILRRLNDTTWEHYPKVIDMAAIEQKRIAENKALSEGLQPSEEFVLPIKFK